MGELYWGFIGARLVGIMGKKVETTNLATLGGLGFRVAGLQVSFWRLHCFRIAAL